jgi:hypothetical protein
VGGGGSGKDYPLQKKRHSLEFLRSIAHLRPRSNTFGYPPLPLSPAPPPLPLSCLALYAFACPSMPLFFSPWRIKRVRA